MFKTCLRAIRRYYVRLFKEENPLFYRKNKIPYQNSIYEKSVKDFCRKHFEGHPNADEIFYYIIALIRQEWYTEIKDVPKHVQLRVDLIYKCFNKFKLWLFEELAEDPNVQLLFDCMIKDNPERIIFKEKSMRCKKEVYLDVFRLFKQYARSD